MILSETSHPGEDRPLWIEFIAEECAKVLSLDIPFLGVCIYPIIDRPDWDKLSEWHQSGLWDKEMSDYNFSTRVLYEPFAEALREAQVLIDNVISDNEEISEVFKTSEI